MTDRGTFKRCRRRWHYASKSQLGLEPVLKGPALVLGSLVHHVLPDWAAGKDPTKSYQDHATELLVDISKHYASIVGVSPSQEELEPLVKAMRMAAIMIENYVDYYKTPFQEGFHLLASEQTLLVDVPGTEHCPQYNCECRYCREPDAVDQYGFRDCHCLHESHKLEATLDGVLEDDYGSLYVLEHKTYDRRPNDQDLAYNDQFLAYMWALKKTFPDRAVKGIAYNGLWKRDKIPNGKTRDDLFMRKLLLRSPDELDEFSLYVAAELNEMASLDYNIHPEKFYKTVPPVGGCWDCGFRNLCNAQSRGEDLTYILVNYSHRPDYYSQEEGESD